MKQQVASPAQVLSIDRAAAQQGCGAPFDYDRYHRSGRTAEFGDVFERVRARTVEQLLQLTPEVLAANSLIDVGCGEGRYLPIWRQYLPGARLVAVDVSTVAIERSSARHPFAEHRVGPADALPVPDASVDCVASIEVIEHVEHPRQMLEECHRVLRPSGFALISTPCGNRGSFEWWGSYLRGEVRPVKDGGVRFERSEDPTHLRRYRSSEFAALLREVGLEPRLIVFNGHIFLTLAFRLEWLVNRNINLARRSQSLARAFARTVDGIGLLDWRMFRGLPFASSMIAVAQKRVSRLPSQVELERG
jgi:2-polyprenyl-3-methyl-5-hydroxy-6-metoxy-1,4-benzoquinol methylase